MKNNNFSHLLVLASLNLLLSYFSTELLQTKELYTATLSEALTHEQVRELLSLQSKWEWVGYLILPIYLLLKISIIAAVIDIGVFFYNKKMAYGKLFSIVLKAEYLFLLVIIIKTAWLYFFVKDFSLEDVQNFYPFSMLHLVGTAGIDSWYLYPLQILNVFELAYWVVLAYLLGKALPIKVEKAFEIVLSSYGVGFFIWVIAIMFLVLNMS